MRKTDLSRRLVMTMLCSAPLVTAGLPALAQERPVVAAVNYPLAYFAQRLVGDTADVLFPVPLDSDPAFWRPGIAEITAIQSAEVIALNGAGYASWTTKVSLSRSRTVDTSSAFSDEYIATGTVTHSHGEGGQHSHTGVANYFWLDFALASRQAETLAAALVRRMPDAQQSITKNLMALVADLAELDTSAKGITKLVADQTAIASHPRYQYLARAYGLEISALEWDAHEEVAEEQWQSLQNLITQTGARLFIWEAEPTPQARAMVEAMGLRNVVFPPLANRPASGDFLDQMAQSVDRLKEALTT